MAAGGFLNIARFTATSSGTGDFVVSSAVTGYQTPASAGAVNATVYSYRAESADLTEWEIGEGAYTTGTTTLARTTVHASTNGGAKVSFTAAPQVAVTALAGDLLVKANNLSDVASASTAFTNIKQAASDSATGAIEIAIQSEMETGTSTTLAVTPGRQHYHPGHPKHWLRATESGGGFSATASYNHSSITDSGVGDLTFNITTAFSASDAAGAAIGGGNVNGSFLGNANNYGTSAIDMNIFRTDTLAAFDASAAVIQMGDQ
jgi:hypothetical protein